ncbi:unnamed protein product [Mycena citricolor]|uniref:P-loop containing nucleoside triphosphate hydrolase protein n=1 Tax=Mycena citricolor TaxID=2018698 RepID=A0AAD2K4S9_9AGAR|nr:unnamed protein product [Mycena citricolor]
MDADVDEARPRFDWRLSSSQLRRQREEEMKNNDKSGSTSTKRTHPPSITVGQGEPFYDAIQLYTERFTEMLVAEQQEAEAVLKERLSTWSLTRLQEEGYSITGLSSFWLQETQFGLPVASFSLGPGISLPEHRFDNGSTVLVSRLDPLKEGNVTGSVISSSKSQIRVTFRERLLDFEDGLWRLDVGNSNIAHERQLEAVRNLNHDPQQLEEVPVSSDREVILLGTHLRDVLLDTFQPGSEDEEMTSKPVANAPGVFADDQRIHSWALRYAKPDPLVMEGDPPLTGLNETQIRAMALMIGKRLSLIQGPPGTGKTKTIIETIKLLKVHFDVPHPLLVCTYTNVAVDNLVEGFAAANMRPLRVGSAGRVKESLKQYTLHQKLAEHPLQQVLEPLQVEKEKLEKQLDELDTKIDEAEKKTKTANNKAAERLLAIRLNMDREKTRKQRQHRSLKGRVYALQMKMLKHIIMEADVICTTCITSACQALQLVDFPVVFLDEASMSTEPATLVPIMKGSRHLSLIGDHKQLPPVISSLEAKALGLGRSLFERLTDEGEVPSIMLDTQYRMHPAISSFPSSEFYNFRLRDGTVDPTGTVAARLTPPNSVHLPVNERGDRPAVIFLDHVGGEAMKDRSRVNLPEAAIVISVIEDLLLNNPTLNGNDIGVIAPYVAQISRINRMLNTDAKYADRFQQVLGSHRAMQMRHIEVKTVDGFEGREKEVIIFSTVRNNSGGHIGFLADKRRLNVGLTRAKRGLFVIGSIKTLGDGLRADTKVAATAATPVPAPAAPAPVDIAQISDSAQIQVVPPRKRKSRGSWKRYTDWLLDQGLVITLGGEALSKVLYGNVPKRKVPLSAKV